MRIGKIFKIIIFLLLLPGLLFVSGLVNEVIARYLGLSWVILMRTSVQYENNILVKAPRVQTWRLEIPREYTMRYYAYGSWFDRNILALFNRKLSFGSLVYSKEILPGQTHNISVVSILSGVDPVQDVIMASGAYDSPRFKGTPTHSFTFSIQNQPAKQRLVDNEFCLTEQAYDNRKPTKKNIGDCAAGNKNCSYIVNYKGWFASVSVSKDYIKVRSKDEICKLAVQKIDKWTVQVDDLRIGTKSSRGTQP